MDFSASIELRAQPTGTHALVIQEVARVCPDTSRLVNTGNKFFAYDVLPACAVEPPPIDSLVRTFTSLRVAPEHPCAGDSVSLRLVKNACGPGCVHLDGLDRHAKSAASSPA